MQTRSLKFTAFKKTQSQACFPPRNSLKTIRKQQDTFLSLIDDFLIHVLFNTTMEYHGCVKTAHFESDEKCGLPQSASLRPGPGVERVECSVQT